jgi:hypothetical protein
LNEIHITLPPVQIRKALVKRLNIESNITDDIKFHHIYIIILTTKPVQVKHGDKQDAYHFILHEHLKKTTRRRLYFIKLGKEKIMEDGRNLPPAVILTDIVYAGR